MVAQTVGKKAVWKDAWTAFSKVGLLVAWMVSMRALRWAATMDSAAVAAMVVG